MAVVEGYYYTKEHEWIDIRGNGAAIGITDYAQQAMGDIVYVDLPEVDAVFDAEDAFAVVESVKAAADIYMPVTGTIVEVNEALEDSPELLNEAPFDNPIAIIANFDEEAVKDLMDSNAYEDYCNSLD